MFHALICGVVITAVIDIKDVEDDGTHTHLLRADYVPAKTCSGSTATVASNYNPIYISYTAPVALGQQGQRVNVLLSAECYGAHGVDEETSSRTNTWITFTSWVCSATDVRVLPALDQ